MFSHRAKALNRPKPIVRSSQRGAEVTQLCQAALVDKTLDVYGKHFYSRSQLEQSNSRTASMGKAECISYDDNQLPYIDLGSAKIRMDKEQAPEWALKKAQDELRELPGIKEAAIKELRELIQAEKYLNLPLDDEYMMMFLRPCHYYPESALQRVSCEELSLYLLLLYLFLLFRLQLKNFYNMKMKYGQACENIVPTKLRNVFEADVLNLLPTRDQHGRRLLVLEAGSKFP